MYREFCLTHFNTFPIDATLTKIIKLKLIFFRINELTCRRLRNIKIKFTYDHFDIFATYPDVTILYHGL